MHTQPIIKATGTVSGAGTAGVDKTDVEAGETLTFEDTNASNADLAYEWELVYRPYGSAAVLEDADTDSPSLDVDVVGTYKVQATVTSLRQVGDGDVATLVCSAPLPQTGIVIPDFTRPAQVWAAIEAFMRAADGGTSYETVEATHAGTVTIGSQHVSYLDLSGLEDDDAKATDLPAGTFVNQEKILVVTVAAPTPAAEHDSGKLSFAADDGLGFGAFDVDTAGATAVFRWSGASWVLVSSYLIPDLVP
jgi:hypothetical protein